MSKFIVQNEYFSIEDTLTCGQVFRYKKIADDAWEVYSLDKRCALKTLGDGVEFETDDEQYFRDYFDLSFDYGKVVEKLQAFSELEKPINCGKGIRILRQNLYETIISFIISANNNIKRIQGIIEKLCARYGSGKNGYYAFPTLDQLQRATVAELKEIGLGYRAEYIYETARVLDNALQSLSSEMDDESARKVLLSLKGIGPKVADCIMLFGLRRFSSYPVDTWIFKANQTDELNTPQKVREFYSSRYGEYAGLAQQYIFHYTRNFLNKQGE